MNMHRTEDPELPVTEPVPTRQKTSISASPPRRDPAGRNPGRPKKRMPRYLLLAVCCFAGAGAGVYASRQKQPPQQPERLAYEANVVAGDIPGKSKEERQQELDHVVEEGMLAMSMNVTPSGMAAGADRSVNWLIENPSNQGKLIRVEVTRDDTGEKIYETGAIRPGSYLESAPPDMVLPAGEYDCTAVFFAYQEETEALIGQAAVKIKLTLQE